MRNWSARGATRLGAAANLGEGLGSLLSSYLGEKRRQENEAEAFQLLNNMRARGQGNPVPTYASQQEGGFGGAAPMRYDVPQAQGLLTMDNMPDIAKIGRLDPGLLNTMMGIDRMNQPNYTGYSAGEAIMKQQYGQAPQIVGQAPFRPESPKDQATPPVPKKFRAADGYYHEQYFDGTQWKDRKTSERWPVTEKTGAGSGGFKPSAGDAKFMSDYAVLEKDLGEIQKSFKPEWVGPIAGRWQEAQSAAGKLPKEQERFRAQVAGVRNKFLNVLSGAAISPAESERLMQQLPTVTDSEPAFREKVGLTLENVKFVQKKYQESRSKGASSLMDKPAGEMTDEELDAFIEGTGR